MASNHTPGEASIEIEVDPALAPEGFRQTSGLTLKPTIADAERFLEPLPRLVGAVLDRIKSSVQNPKEITITLGLKFGLEGQVIIAKGTAESNLVIELKYGGSD
jgi:hypothetical protein